MNIGIIPCRLTSERLKRKNLQKIGDKTLLEIAIDYLQTSAYINKIEVYSDDITDPEIQTIVNKYPNVRLRSQPRDAQGRVYEYLTDLFLEIYKKNYCKMIDDINYMITTTCDNPIKPDNLDDIINYCYQKGLHEYVTFSESQEKIGALHIISKYALENNRVSGYMGYTCVNGIDIHTKEDLKKAKKCFTRENQKS